MLHLIVGNNCKGKTTCIKNKFYELAESNCSVISNFMKYGINPICDNSLKIIKDKLIINNIFNMGNQTIIDTREDYSIEFIELLKILSYDVDVILLDEPDKNLSEHEIYGLAVLVHFISSYKDIWITTNLDAYCSCNHIMYTPDDNYRLKEDYSYGDMLM